MKLGRSTIVRAILALGAAGTIAGSVAAPIAATAAPSAVVVAGAPASWYHG